MSEEQRLRDEAARAERWALAMTDRQMTERLMQIARDYLRRADELQRAAGGGLRRGLPVFPFIGTDRLCPGLTSVI